MKRSDRKIAVEQDRTGGRIDAQRISRARFVCDDLVASSVPHATIRTLPDWHPNNDVANQRRIRCPARGSAGM
jgi:hypothetical protein